jgi:hypothetical protein
MFGAIAQRMPVQEYSSTSAISGPRRPTRSAQIPKSKAPNGLMTRVAVVRKASWVGLAPKVLSWAMSDRTRTIMK